MPKRKMSGYGRPRVRPEILRAQALNYKRPIRSVIGETDRHKCRRCFRILPSGAFGPMLHYKSPRRETWRVEFLHPFCWECRRQLNGEHVVHPLYSPKVDRRITDLVQRFASMAVSRQLLFLIDKEDVFGMYLRQDGKCSLTGLAFSLDQAAGVKNNLAPSLDRIDSAGNYTLDNVQLVAAYVNIAKNDLSQESFIRMCRLIAEMSYRKELVDLVESTSGVASSPQETS